jgi:hypothetical protein
MRSVLKDVVVLGLVSDDDIIDLAPNLDHSITEPMPHQQPCMQYIRFSYLSISSKVSDSVGSINIQVEMGQEHVGGWKP